MDYRLSESEEAFKNEVHSFFEKEGTQDIADDMQSNLGPGKLARAFLHKLGERNWLCCTLPKNYGGMGLSPMYKHILLQEIYYFAPFYVWPAGISSVAPVIMQYGTEEQKTRFLPMIARGESEFALGYTEPEAGTDLASVSIRARADGDNYIISGQKIFNTACHYANYHWLCARTEDTKPKHKGLSLFIVPMDSPGITISPLFTVSGMRNNQIYYDEVVVPKNNLVGQKNQGFYQMVTALEHERLLPTANLKRAYDLLSGYVKEALRDGKKLVEDSSVRQTVAELGTLVEIAQWMGYKNAWLLTNGKLGPKEASSAKIFCSELDVYLGSSALRILGLSGQLSGGSKYAPLNGWLQRWYLRHLQFPIAAGSNEIQRNLIAQRGFDMPRD